MLSAFAPRTLIEQQQAKSGKVRSAFAKLGRGVKTVGSGIYNTSAHDAVAVARRGTSKVKGNALRLRLQNPIVPPKKKAAKVEETPAEEAKATPNRAARRAAAPSKKAAAKKAAADKADTTA